MERTILVALFALLTSNIALAAKWLPITNSSDSYWFLDSSSLRSTKSTTTGWAKVEVRMKSIKMDGVKSKIIKYIADCKARKIQALT